MRCVFVDWRRIILIRPFPLWIPTAGDVKCTSGQKRLPVVLYDGWWWWNATAPNLLSFFSDPQNDNKWRPLMCGGSRGNKVSSGGQRKLGWCLRWWMLLVFSDGIPTRQNIKKKRMEEEKGMEKKEMRGGDIVKNTTTPLYFFWWLLGLNNEEGDTYMCIYSTINKEWEG